MQKYKFPAIPRMVHKKTKPLKQTSPEFIPYSAIRWKCGILLFLPHQKQTIIPKKKIPFSKDLSFQPQEGNFVVHAATISDKLPVGTNHPMAGHNETNWIPTHCTTNSLRRIDIQTFGYLTISLDLSKRDFTYSFQDRLAKRSEAVHAKGWREIRLVSGEISVQPTAGVVNDGR